MLNGLKSKFEDVKRKHDVSINTKGSDELKQVQKKIDELQKQIDLNEKNHESNDENILDAEKKLNQKTIEIERHKESDSEKEVKSKSLKDDIEKLDKGLSAEKDKLHKNRENLRKKRIANIALLDQKKHLIDE